MTRMVRWAGIGCLVVAGGCAHLGTGQAGRAGQGLPLDTYVPLAVGNRWTYATTFQGQPQPDLSVVLVKEENGFFVDDRPSPSRMRFDAEGLRDGAVRYLLKAPVVAGTKWMSVADLKTVERYEIIAAGHEVRVPAGVFKDCATVRMEVRINDRQSMFNHMTFAPGVGLVEIRVEFKDGARVLPQSQLLLKTYELKSTQTDAPKG